MDSCQEGKRFQELGEKGERVKQRKKLINTGNNVVIVRGKRGRR